MQQVRASFEGGNITGSCKLNNDASIHYWHSNPDFAPSGYVHIGEVLGRTFSFRIVLELFFIQSVKIIGMIQIHI